MLQYETKKLSEFYDILVAGDHQSFDHTYYTIKPKYNWNGIYTGARPIKSHAFGIIMVNQTCQ